MEWPPPSRRFATWSLRRVIVVYGHHNRFVIASLRTAPRCPTPGGRFLLSEESAGTMQSGMLAKNTINTTDMTRWQLVRAALRGQNAHPTEGSIGSSIVLLAVPMVLEMMM